jgi:hypothetical protein
MNKNYLGNLFLSKFFRQDLRNTETKHEYVWGPIRIKA